MPVVQESLTQAPDPAMKEVDTIEATCGVAVCQHLTVCCWPPGVTSMGGRQRSVVQQSLTQAPDPLMKEVDTFEATCGVAVCEHLTVGCWQSGVPSMGADSLLLVMQGVRQGSFQCHRCADLRC